MMLEGRTCEGRLTDETWKVCSDAGFESRFDQRKGLRPVDPPFGRRNRSNEHEGPHYCSSGDPIRRRECFHLLETVGDETLLLLRSVGEEEEALDEVPFLLQSAKQKSVKENKEGLKGDKGECTGKKAKPWMACSIFVPSWTKLNKYSLESEDGKTSPHHISQRIQRERCCEKREAKKASAAVFESRRVELRRTYESVVLEHRPVSLSVDERAVEAVLLGEVGFSSL